MGRGLHAILQGDHRSRRYGPGGERGRAARGGEDKVVQQKGLLQEESVDETLAG